MSDVPYQAGHPSASPTHGNANAAPAAPAAQPPGASTPGGEISAGEHAPFPGILPTQARDDTPADAPADGTQDAPDAQPQQQPQQDATPELSAEQAEQFWNSVEGTQEEIDDLRLQWGPSAGAKLNAARSWAEALPKDTIDFLDQCYFVDANENVYQLGSHPRGLALAALMGEQLAKPSTQKQQAQRLSEPGPSDIPGSPANPANVDAEIAQLKARPDYWQSEAVQKRVSLLFSRKYGDAPAGGRGRMGPRF